MLDYIKKAWSILSFEDRNSILESHKKRLHGMGSLGMDLLTGAALIELRKASQVESLTELRLKVEGFLNACVSAETKSTSHIDGSQLVFDWTFWT